MRGESINARLLLKSISPILTTIITLKRLQKKGYESMLEYYLKVSPQLNEPLYTRPLRTVV